MHMRDMTAKPRLQSPMVLTFTVQCRGSLRCATRPVSFFGNVCMHMSCSQCSAAADRRLNSLWLRNHIAPPPTAPSTCYDPGKRPAAQARTPTSENRLKGLNLRSPPPFPAKGPILCRQPQALVARSFVGGSSRIEADGMHA